MQTWIVSFESRPASENPPRRAGRPSIAPALLPFALSALLLGACGSETAVPTAENAAPAEDNRARAERMAQEMLIVDTHVDLPYRLKALGTEVDITQRQEEGDFDVVRAREGGLDAPFMSIYIPAEHQETGDAKVVADDLIDMVGDFAVKWPDQIVIANSPDEVEAAKAAGKLALPLGMENGAPVGDDLANVQYFYDRGIRYITLTHSKNNQICDSSYEEPDERTWNGLSPFGREVVAEMNRVGMLVDISHVSDAAFFQVMEIARAPAIATHSSARHFTPGFERNMSDEMIQALAENGGVIHINFGSSFLTEEANSYGDTHRPVIREYLETNNLEWGSPEAEAWMAEYRQQNPYPYATVDDVVAHIDHVVKLVGIDHVGLGSDYDGVGDTLPEGLKDASTFPNLIAALLDKGYTEEDIEKILSGNLMRVWREVEKVAAELRASAEAA